MNFYVMMNNDVNELDKQYGYKLAHPKPGERIVISGLAGRYPDADNTQTFKECLFNKVDLVSDDTRRWIKFHDEIPQRTGKLYDINKLDAGFFGLPQRYANYMDPMIRMTMEKAVEAVIDAGLNPMELEGTKTGVIIGICSSETEKKLYYEQTLGRVGGVIGCTRSLTAQRISYHLKLNGQSFTADTACSSSSYAINIAYESIRNGFCDQAIVGGVNLCLSPYFSLQFSRLGMLSLEGICKAFDNDADGYVRSEAVSCVFLQKEKNARRIYAKVIHSKLNCDGYKSEGITFPASEVQTILLKEFYEECDVLPSSISYVEAHGTGTKVGDPEELVAIDKIFCKNRKDTLLIGSVKSNIGHTEPASFMCSLAKVLYAMETNCIPPNINFKTPRLDVDALQTGRIKVVTEKLKWENHNGLVAINNFGFGGANSHVLLQQHDKVKIISEEPNDNLPRLVCVGGRTKGAIVSILNDLKIRKLDCEYIRLFHEIFSKPLQNERFRGFSIISKNGELTRSISKYFQPKRIAFVFQTLDDVSTCIQSLLQLRIFKQTVIRIQEIVTKIKKINLFEVVKNYKSTNTLHKLLLTTTLNIGLVDLMRELQIVPDYYIGSFIGELVCAYYENVLALQKIIEIIFYLSKESIQKSEGETKSHFSMAEILTNLIPLKPLELKKWKHWDECDPNNTELTTLLIKALVFPREHYDISNIFSKDTILVKISDNINAQSVGVECINLLGFGAEAPLTSLLYNLGRLHEFGITAKLDKLYTEINWPVSRGTPMISPLLKWDYNKNLFVAEAQYLGNRKFDRYVINEKYNDWSYISGHIVNERNLFPAAGYLSIIMESFAKLRWSTIRQMNMCFENVKFIRASYVPAKTSIMFDVTIEHDGYFYLFDVDGIVVSGRIYELENPEEELVNINQDTSRNPEFLPLASSDIYKELRLRGYNYRGAFRAILECSNLANKGKVKWDDNWITFLDGMMQMQILQEDTRNLYIPTFVQQIIVYPDLHFNSIENEAIEINVDRNSKTIRAGGVQMRGIGCAAISKRKPLSNPVLESYQFVPNEATLHPEQSVRVNIQIILENYWQQDFKTFEIFEADENSKNPLSSFIQNALEDQPLIHADVKLFSKLHFEFPGVSMSDIPVNCETNLLLVVGRNLLSNVENLEEILAALDPHGFILTRESLFYNTRNNTPNLTIITVHKTTTETLILLKRNNPSKDETFFEIPNDLTNLTWIPKLQKELAFNPNLTIVSKQKNYNGILGFFNCLRREPGKSNLKCIFILNDTNFNPEDKLFRDQIRKQMTINVLNNLRWGTYRHLSIEEATIIKAEQAYAVVASPGDFSSLTWVEGPLSINSELEDDHILVHIYYSALNFRDILTASGRLPFDIGVKTRLCRMGYQGLEFSGRDARGRRVVGMSQRGALSTIFAADKYMLWEVPDGWSMEDAVTTPVVYATVLYAFKTAGGLKAGQKLLIHSGTGGVGQAAINVALYHKCIVFTTVGTKEKREFLIKQFPQINPDHIGNSRDLSFEEMVRKHTNGQGVDMVLNSLAEEKLFASLRCIARKGHMLEIGKFDLVSNNEFSMYIFEKEISVHGIMLDLVFEVDIRKTVQKMLSEAFEVGLIKPLHRTVFNREKIEDAFRYMASGKHVGKVLINIRPEERELHIPKQMFFDCKAKYYCNPVASYIIVGGLGGFGMELADWLVMKGCRKIVLVSRNGVQTGYQDLRIRFWKKYIDKIIISTGDVTTYDGCIQIINEASNLGPVDGIFNLAVVLKDGLFDNLTIENFQSSLDPKALATKHLDKVSRHLCPSLRHFVVFSSVSCGRGNPGQTNYGMSNSIMERICEQRRTDGLPALAVEWGAVGDVGLVANMSEMNKDVVISGTLQQRISNCIQILDSFLCHNATITSCMVVAEKRAGANVEEVISNILGIKDLRTINLQMTLPELGMDSITGVEIKQIIERDFDITLTPQEMKTMTFIKIREFSEKRNMQETSDAAPVQQVDWLSLVLRNMKQTHLRDVPFVTLPSLVTPTESTSAYLLPGIEGMCSVLEPFAAMLKCNAIGFQFLFTYPNDSIENLAQAIFDQMSFKTRTCNLVAYSYGCVVAIELIRLFEKAGKIVNSFFIDGAPMFFKKMFHKIFTVENEEYLKTSLLLELISSNAPSDTATDVKAKILKCSTFETQLNTALEIVSNHDYFSRDYIEQSYYAIYYRLKALKHYKHTGNKLKSKIKLFRPVNSEVLSDYGLSEIFEQTVEVTFLDGDHVSILQNLELVNEINVAIENYD